MTSFNSNSISAFKTNFYGGTRPNRFNVTATWPTGINAVAMNDKTSFKIITASFPEAVVEPILVPYRGRPIMFAGDRKYTPWRITVLDDSEVSNLWQVFHRWMEEMDGSKNHYYQNQGNTDFTYQDHQTTFTIRQLDSNATTIRTIILQNVWPVSVGAISFDMKEASQVSFDVELHFDYMTFGSDTIT